jgi:hypothetical protein
MRAACDSYGLLSPDRPTTQDNPAGLPNHQSVERRSPLVDLAGIPLIGFMSSKTTKADFTSVFQMMFRAV